MKLLEVLVEDPLKAAAICALILVFWFLKRDYEKRDEQFEKYESKMRVWGQSVHQTMKECREALNKHSDDLGKATKAINGDMLKIQEAVFGLKQQLAEKIEGLRSTIAQMERESKALASNMELVAEKFDSKFARFVELKKETEYLKSRVEKLDESFGKVKVVLENLKGSKQ